MKKTNITYSRHSFFETKSEAATAKNANLPMYYYENKDLINNNDGHVSRHPSQQVKPLNIINEPANYGWTADDSFNVENKSTENITHHTYN